MDWDFDALLKAGAKETTHIAEEEDVEFSVLALSCNEGLDTLYWWGLDGVSHAIGPFNTADEAMRWVGVMKDEEVKVDLFISNLTEEQVGLLADWCNIVDGFYDGEPCEPSAAVRAELCDLGHEKLDSVVEFALSQNPDDKGLLRLNDLWKEANA